jgi:hypothetical protein
MDEIDADAAQVAAEHDDDATDDLGRTPIPEDV